MNSRTSKRIVTLLSKLRFSNLLAGAMFPFLLAPLQVSLQAGEKIYVGKKQSAAAFVSIDEIDHQVWNDLLKTYVDENGMVDYQMWQKNPADVQRLDIYLATLSTADPAAPTPRESQLAFWINTYNAVTVRGILNEYPTSSIRNHTAKLFGYNIWHDLLITLGDQQVSLDHIEHKILRKMGEPRIHFAIVCASIGCPRLLNRAYEPGKLEAQLDDNARDFFNRSQNFRHDQAGNRFYFSAILNWFSEDFGSSQPARLRKISAWLPTDAARQAARENSVSIRYLDYNWDLNQQP